MNLIEKYSSWIKYSDQFTSREVLTEIISDLKWLEDELPKDEKTCDNCKFLSECRFKQDMPQGQKHCKFYILKI